MKCLKNRTSALIQYTLLILLTFSIYGCLSYQDVEYKGIEDVEVQSISMSGVKAKLFIKVHNPNNYKIKILGGSFSIASEGVSLGDFDLSDQVEIPKNSTTTIPITLDAKLKSLFSPETLKLISHLQKNEIPITVNGHITAGAYFIKKKIPIEVNEKISL